MTEEKYRQAADISNEIYVLGRRYDGIHDALKYYYDSAFGDFLRDTIMPQITQKNNEMIAELKKEFEAI